MRNEESKTNLVFVAGGLNTRFNEYNRIPKLLLPYEDNDSVLIWNLKMIDHCDANIIIHRQYYEMVQNYVKVNNLEVSVFPIDNSDGSYWAIHEASHDGMFPQEDIVFVWSDIIFKEPIAFSQMDEVVIGTREGDYRYFADSDRIRNINKAHMETGNVPGVYYFPTFEGFTTADMNKNNYDLVDFIRDHVREFDTWPLPEITEFRDIDIYIKEMNFDPIGTSPRFFNKLIFDGNQLTKHCVDPNYINLIQTEMEWYKTAKRLEINAIPEIYHYGHDYIIMEYLEDSEPLDTYLRRTKDFDVFNEFVLPSVQGIHSQWKESVDSMRMLKDTKIEFYDKVLNRVGSIDKMILDFDYSEFNEVIHTAYKMLISKLDIRYGHEPFYVFTHGDLNGSNTMINPKTGKVKFIDPRGYYGETKMLGLAEYDMAKLYYFLHGYDHFNNGFYLYADKDNFDAPECIYKPSRLQDPIMEIMLGFIYVNLSSYISNNVMKANIAYHHGMNILKEAINNEQF